MNRIFRIIRNPQTCQCAVASELAPRRGRRTRGISAIAAGIATCIATPAMAIALNGEHYVSGVTPSYPWQQGEFVEVGKNGGGNLWVSEGIEMPVASSLMIGVTGWDSAVVGEATVVVSGPNASLSSNNFMTIGDTGEGSLHIDDGGGVWNHGIGYIGFTGGSNGTLTVRGMDSTFRNSDYFMVGGHGSRGALAIARGGRVVTEDWAFIGYGRGSKGVVDVHGDAQWQSQGNLVVGYQGKGALNISNGGTVLVGEDMFVAGHPSGSSPDTEGHVLVTGSGSVLRVDGPVGIIVGGPGPGRLTVADGAAIESGMVVNAYDNAHIEVKKGGHLSGKYMQVGGLGEATMTIADGSSVEASELRIGKGDVAGQAAGRVDVSDSLLFSTKLWVGYFGAGVLDVASGSTVESRITEIGYADFSDGAVTVAGDGAQWTNAADVVIGYWGRGRLGSSDGGRVSIGADTVLGYFSDSHGSADVSAGAKLTIGGTLNIGRQGTGALTVGAGGEVSSANAVLGDVRLGRFVGEGTAVVSGAGALWKSTGSLIVGNAGRGTLSIADGGSVAVAGRMTVGHTGKGTVDVSSGGALRVDGGLAVAAHGLGYLNIADAGNLHSAWGSIGGSYGSYGS
ncbi:MAG: ESPR-type extended signal peptide-containing protein, partial [Stenotrophomonas sp.]